jgi:hypothetical protein
MPVSEQWDADIESQGRSVLFVRAATPRPLGTKAQDILLCCVMCSISQLYTECKVFEQKRKNITKNKENFSPTLTIFWGFGILF